MKNMMFHIDDINLVTVHYNDEHHKFMAICRIDEEDDDDNGEEYAQQLDEPKITFQIQWGGDLIFGKKLCQCCGYYFDEGRVHVCQPINLDTKSAANVILHQYRLRDNCQMNINGDLVKRKRTIKISSEPVQVQQTPQASPRKMLQP